MDQGVPRKRQTFKSYPLVWDTGALFGLTPFCQDFIDYTECSIPVNDIARTNTVIGIGTTLHKFKADGEDIFMAYLSYHLPLADVRLFSPQTVHTLYGGHSTVFGDKVEMFIESLCVGVGINRETSTVPMVFDCWVSPEEMREHGPKIQSALPQYKRKVDFLGGWSSTLFQEWIVACTEIDVEFGHYAGSGYACLNISSEANQNLSSAQKELLLWNWKLGISLQRIQELMRVVEVKEPNGAVSTMPRVSTPKIKSVPTVQSHSASCVSFLGQSSESPRLCDLKL